MFLEVTRVKRQLSLITLRYEEMNKHHLHTPEQSLCSVSHKRGPEIATVHISTGQHIYCGHH